MGHFVCPKCGCKKSYEGTAVVTKTKRTSGGPKLIMPLGETGMYGAIGPSGSSVDYTEEATIRLCQECDTLLGEKDYQHTNESLSEVRQMSANEAIIASAFDTAFDHVCDALGRLGSVEQVNRNEHSITGSIRYGLQSVDVHVSLEERSEKETSVVIQGSSDDVWGVAARSATKRLFETLSNLNNPDYQPNQLGMQFIKVVGVLIGFVILMVVITVIVGQAITDL